MAKWRVTFKVSKGNISSTPYTDVVAASEEEAAILAESSLRKKLPLNKDYDWQVTSIRIIK